MADRKNIRVAVNGYGVIGKRVAAAVALQDDMSLAGVSDVVTDWRARAAIRNGLRLFGATSEHTNGMRAAGLEVARVDCQDKRRARHRAEVDLTGRRSTVVESNPLPNSLKSRARTRWRTR